MHVIHLTLAVACAVAAADQATHTVAVPVNVSPVNAVPVINATDPFAALPDVMRPVVVHGNDVEKTIKKLLRHTSNETVPILTVTMSDITNGHVAALMSNAVEEITKFDGVIVLSSTDRSNQSSEATTPQVTEIAQRRDVMAQRPDNVLHFIPQERVQKVLYKRDLEIKGSPVKWIGVFNKTHMVIQQPVMRVSQLKRGGTVDSDNNLRIGRRAVS